MAYFTQGYKTETAGTEITALCPPNGTMIPVLRSLIYTTGGATAHTITIMSPLGVTTTASFTASGATTMELAKLDVGQNATADDEDLATNDFVVYQTRHGGYEARKITGVSGATLTIAATGDDVDNGAKVYGMYEMERSCFPTLEVPASTTYRIYDNVNVQGGIPYQRGGEIAVSGSGMPMLVVSENLTNAGLLEMASFEWIAAEEDFLQ